MEARRLRALSLERALRKLRQERPDDDDVPMRDLDPSYCRRLSELFQQELREMLGFPKRP